jgi:hypothetical protein
MTPIDGAKIRVFVGYGKSIYSSTFSRTSAILAIFIRPAFWQILSGNRDHTST